GARRGLAVGIGGGGERAGLPVLGVIAREQRMGLPARHLGLVQAAETPDIGRLLDLLADSMEAAVDLDAIRRNARPSMLAAGAAKKHAPPGQRIAVAQARAFSFLYPHLPARWRGRA